MAVGHLIVNIYATDNVWYASYNPENVLSEGLSKDGYITFTGYDGDDPYVRLFTGPYSSSDREAIADYQFPNNTKTKLSDAFPDVSLAGYYLWSSIFSRDDGIPIVNPYTVCTPPTVCALSKTRSDTGESAVLSWSGATAGTNNAITGYEVQRRESSDASTWDSWAALSTTTGTSLTVSAPTTRGSYYQYRVRTQGAAGSAYYSGWKTSSNTFRRRAQAALTAYTDATLTAGETKIKAVHMTQLQANVNAVRATCGLSAYGFTAITAGQTSLGGWTSHVQQLRDALDAAGMSHAAWIAIAANKPTAAVIRQLREITAAQA